MIERFSQYLIDSLKVLPSCFFFVSLSLFFMGLCAFLALLDIRKGMKASAGLLLFEYIFFLYSLTVFFRNTQIEESHLLTPFWSYRAILEGDEQFSIQAIMNVVSFFPIGLLLAYAFQRIRWWGVLLAGGLISFGIEILQLLFHRGFAEFDDVFHNTLGCLMGFGLYVALVHIKRIKKS